MKIQVDVTGIAKTGINKAQRPYFIYSGYVHLPEVKYPQLIQFYSEAVYQPGVSLTVPVVPGVTDSKPTFTVDFSSAQLTAKAAA